MTHPFADAGQPFGRPLSAPGAGRIPVVVVTGFLGAGKTTLVRELLASAEAADTALIVNEFGEVGIDDALLRPSTESIALLRNGCLCCAARSDLHGALRELFAERSQGRVPAFGRVLIETSGLADPGPILQTFATDRTLGTTYALSAVVTVVDAATALTSASCPEWAKQVAIADRIVIAKTDLVRPEILSAVERLLDRANPLAPRKHAIAGRIAPEFILEPARIRAATPLRCDEAPEAPADHAAPYRTFTITFDRPLAWPVFARAMDVLTSLRGEDLLRVKGLVAVKGRRGPVVVHFVQHLAHPPEELVAWPDEDRRTRLVFITRHLERDRVATLLESVLAVDRAQDAATTGPEAARR